MEAMLGFQPGFWDAVTLLCFLVIAAGFLGLAILILGLPGRIAIRRNHPDAEAVNLMGWVGFLAIVPWVQALIWAFRPADIVDIRTLPEARARETRATLARLRHGAAPPAAGEGEAGPGG